MKKWIALFLAVLMCLALAACGKSDAAKAADEAIAAIGEVTADSEESIVAAETAVAALSEDDVKSLDNMDTLTKARADYDALVFQAQAAQVDSAIAAIGSVTLDSQTAISDARALYDGSAPEVQAYVTGLETLESAEAQINDLLVAEVTGLIDDIGTVSLESAGKIDSAQAAFDALSPENAAKVSNAAVLQDAAAQLKTLRQQQAEALLATMRLDEDKVNRMKFYSPSAITYYSNGTWAADLRCFVLPYIGQDDNNVWLRLICNYTQDSWVFFEKITFAVDEERYTMNFSYNDVVRDNGGGVVWEYVDVDVSDADEEMLWAIANSKETIVRFEGDDYVWDFTVTSSDKQAIRDVLTAYDAMK